MPLFQRAQELAGNLSSAIAQALSRYVEIKEAQMLGLEEITVHVRMHKQKRFMGTRLVKWQHQGESGQVESFTVYRTAGGRFAVHRQSHPDWTNPESWDGSGTASWHGWGRRAQ